MFLFPAEYARVLRPGGRLVFVSVYGERHADLSSPDDVVAASSRSSTSPTAVTSGDGVGTWTVVTKGGSHDRASRRTRCSVPVADRLFEGDALAALEGYVRIPCSRPASTPEWEAHGHLRGGRRAAARLGALATDPRARRPSSCSCPA